MSKRGENIYKRKDGRWEGRYVKCRTLHGKIQYGYVYGKSYSETKAKLKENASAPIRSSSSQATQSALYDEVLKAWLLSSKNRVKESTFSRYNHLVERHIQPLLGRYPISEISTVLLEECIDYLLQNGRLDGSGGLSPKSVSDIITVIVREGETYSTKQLNDISISQAASVILLTKEYQNELCRYGTHERAERLEKGNPNTIKTLVQVAQMTANEESADHQTIIVEVEDNWTAKLVNQIILHKEKLEKCHIIPVYINKVLGQILSQFSIMPELNTVYSELFSNRGAEFFFKQQKWEPDVADALRQYMAAHSCSIPLTIMQTASGNHLFTVANSELDCERRSSPLPQVPNIALNHTYHMLPRNIVMIGHNSKCHDIMNGFTAFRGEHNLKDEDILNITVIDDQKSLEQLNYYREYPYVTKTVIADVFDDTLIRKTIENAIDSFPGATSLLVLSDDNTATEDIDSAALTYLIYVQDIIFERQKKDPHFNRNKIDVIVEILNPKNYDVVHNYSVDNVVNPSVYYGKR